jgi:hypothetical protein
MRLCVLDWETYWSVTHSLTKMNPIDYVMHPETEIQSVAIKFDHWPTDVLFGEDRIRKAFAKIDWSDTMIVAHNGTGFDHMITAWRMGIRPKAWGCTLAMARPFFGVTVGVSLAKVARALGLGEKLDFDAVNTKGKKLADFTPEEIAKMTAYNKQDTELCYGIFQKLAPLLGKQELQLIDLTTRMLVEPAIEADRYILETALATEKAKKRASLVELANMAGLLPPDTDYTEEQVADVIRPMVMSQPQFAQLLKNLGADIPMKVSPSDPLKLIPALSKKDQGMTDLLDHDDTRVALAAATRLEIKSTQLETRLQTFLDVSRICNGMLPMPINYCGAYISWRMSGGMKMNVQNMPRVNPFSPKPTDALRASLLAPDGKILVVVDSSNIELRVAHMLAGQWDTIERLRNGEDLYSWFASNLYGRKITKADIGERFIGKQAMLSLQYGASWVSFQNMCRVMGKQQGLPDSICIVPEDECKRIVKIWRGMFGAIADKKTGIWKQCDIAIQAMYDGNTVTLGPNAQCFTTLEKIITPAGHWLQYPGLRQVQNSNGYDEWEYGEGRNKSRIYGAHLFENLCQHIARLVVMEQTLAIDKHYPVKLSCHDEAVMVVDEEQGDVCEALALKAFSTAPKWWPDLPLAAEADQGFSYSEAK